MQQLEISTLAPPYSDIFEDATADALCPPVPAFLWPFLSCNNDGSELPPRDGLHAGRRVADCGRQTRARELPARWRGTECCLDQAPSFLRVTLLDLSRFLCCCGSVCAKPAMAALIWWGGDKFLADCDRQPHQQELPGRCHGARMCSAPNVQGKWRVLARMQVQLQECCNVFHDSYTCGALGRLGYTLEVERPQQKR